MIDAHLVDGVRTPIGRFRGGLSDVAPVDLAVTAAIELRRRHGADAISRSVLGNVLQTGNGQNPARQVAVAAGFSQTTYGLTLNDVCLSSMTSVETAALHVTLHGDEAVLVGGLDSMSRADRPVDPEQDGALTIVVADGLTCALEGEVHGLVADRDNAAHGIIREDADTFALASFERAGAAWDRGFYDGEVVPVATGPGVVSRDEGLRETSLERLAALQPAFSPDGTVTAGNASQMSDGAAVGLVAGGSWVASRGIEPMARIVGAAHVAGVGGSLHETPAMAVERLLDGPPWTTGDIDLWEINEAFAGVVLTSTRRLGVDLETVNVNGGAIALGHPLAASGFRLVLTLARALIDRDLERGVAVMCGGGGQGAAVLLERTGT